MLSYKHAFHAGNHADVIKHVSLIAVLEYLKNKNKPFCLIDTHAGAGSYEMSSDEVQKNKEYLSGIDKINTNAFDGPICSRYAQLIEQYAKENLVPGSPLIGLECLRENDAQVLMELHPTEFAKLRKNLRDQRVTLHNRNGFEGVVALSPPKQKRGVVLIDPPYELISEYDDVVSCVNKTLSRWANATIMVWYPLLGGRAGKKSAKSEQMISALCESSNGNVLNVDLCIETRSDFVGMYGSGVLIINPPWQLDQTLNAALDSLQNTMQISQCCVSWLKKVD